VKGLIGAEKAEALFKSDKKRTAGRSGDLFPAAQRETINSLRMVVRLTSNKSDASGLSRGHSLVAPVR